jgi:hypothetical protein
MGRETLKNEDDSVPHDKETFFNSLNVDRLSKLNLIPEDYVALIGGS